mmetsp:Transcript_20783/g.34524  ORF Transcript_20783/g.34524 Transcript_20783/m.34524 type:complete len:83 (-) Transcript_20783:73-321(-)
MRNMSGIALTVLYSLGGTQAHGESSLQSGSLPPRPPQAMPPGPAKDRLTTPKYEVVFAGLAAQGSLPAPLPPAPQSPSQRQP